MSRNSGMQAGHAVQRLFLQRPCRNESLAHAGAMKHNSVQAAARGLEVYSVFSFWPPRNGQKRNSKDTLQSIEILLSLLKYGPAWPGRPARLDKIHPSILRKGFLKLS